jgi:hypothetical protein
LFFRWFPTDASSIFYPQTFLAVKLHFFNKKKHVFYGGCLKPLLIFGEISIHYSQKQNSLLADLNYRCKLTRITSGFSPPKTAARVSNH